MKVHYSILDLVMENCLLDHKGSCLVVVCIVMVLSVFYFVMEYYVLANQSSFGILTCANSLIQFNFSVHQYFFTDSSNLFHI